ncbi:MAG: hypothetical protein RR685_08290 [Hungatella sp.]
MSSKTKIVVLRMKEIIYTAIFIGLAIFLVSLFLIMFRPKKDVISDPAKSVSYVPGIYTSALVLGSQNVNVEVAVDEDHINSIALAPLSDSVTTMYPLMQPVLEDLAAQICENQSLLDLSYSPETHYTSSVLIDAIEKALSKAAVK